MRRSGSLRIAIVMLALGMLVATPLVADAALLDFTASSSAEPAPSAGSDDATVPAQGGSAGKSCDHPYPCGYRWAGPPPPYELHDPERVTVDGFAEEGQEPVKLNGFVLRPELPKGIKVPVILAATPYMRPGEVPANFFVGGIQGKEFASVGYAVAYFSVRGTGDSGGCFGFKSFEEQKDLTFIIDWLANQPWSNGRVGMQGLSYPGTTPVMAAIQNPSALKTIVIAGTILDEYGFVHSPQGASYIPVGMWLFGAAPGTTLNYSLFPWSASSIATAPERVCEEMVRANTTLPKGELTGERDAQFWKTRRFIDGGDEETAGPGGVPGITAATFVVHGFHDRYGSGHAFQDDWAWQTLISAPKRMLVGQWWHEWPNRNSIFGAEHALKDWKERLLAWFDYWLKGWGDAAPGLGEVEFQDSSFQWHRTDAWPPPAIDNSDAGFARRHDEVVYLREEKVTPTPGDEEASFLSFIPPWTGGTDPDLTGIGTSAGDGWRWTAPCPDPTRLVYISDPVEDRTLLAGNAFAYLHVDSSAPGGMFELQLYDVGPDFRCSPQQTGEHIRPLAEGAIDLRYDQGNYKAHDVTPFQPRHVRVDLASLAEVLEPQHKLALVISHGFWRGTTPELFPRITLHGSGKPESSTSHLVLPVVTGGFGGKSPSLDYPPKPFLPKCCSDTP